MTDERYEELILELYREHYDRMLNFAHRMTGNRDEAEDVVSHVFLSLAQEIRRRGAPANPPAWLYRCASNHAISMQRRVKVRLSSVSELWSWLTKRGGRSDHEKVERDMARVRRALLRLRERDRQVIVLRYDEALDFAAIAEVCGVTEVAVRVRLSRAMDRLRRELEANGDE